MYITTRGLVLRQARYKEADKILTVLTEDVGKITLRARGALRKGSRIGAAAQPLVCSEMTLFGNRGRWTLNEAETFEQFLGLREDIASFALGTYFAELLEVVSDEDSPNPAVLHLGMNSLFALSRSLYSPEHIKAVFEMRLMCLSGYEPALDVCAVCGRRDAARPHFNLRGGVLHCMDCPTGDTGRSAQLCGASLAALRHIARADAKKIFSFTMDEESEKRLCRVCEDYVTEQLERGSSTLDYWKDVK